MRINGERVGSVAYIRFGNSPNWKRRPALLIRPQDPYIDPEVAKT